MAQLGLHRALENYPSLFTIVWIRPSFVTLGPGQKMREGFSRKEAVTYHNRRGECHCGEMGT